MWADLLFTAFEAIVSQLLAVGFYGGDCSLSMDKNGKPQLLAGLGYQVRRRKPLIYVYELPPSFNTYMNMRTQDRPLWFMIYQVFRRQCVTWICWM